MRRVCACILASAIMLGCPAVYAHASPGAAPGSSTGLPPALSSDAPPGVSPHLTPGTLPGTGGAASGAGLGVGPGGQGAGPREITPQEYVEWHRGLAAKLEALLTSYEEALRFRDEKRLTREQFSRWLMELSVAAAEVLRESTSVTSTRNPELWGRIAGDAALVAVVYSDIVLAFGRDAAGQAGGDAARDTAAAEDRLGAACDLLRRAVATLTGRELATANAGGGAVDTGGGPTVRQDPDTALFHQYFKDLSVGRLPAEVAAQDSSNWRNHVVRTNMFFYGDIFVMTGEVLKEARLTVMYVDAESGRQVGASGETPALKPGPFTGYNVMALPPGRYEVRCFIDGTLVRVLPFSALGPASRTSM